MNNLLDEQEYQSLIKDDQIVVKLNNVNIEETTTGYMVKLHISTYDYINSKLNSASRQGNLWFYNKNLGDNFVVKAGIIFNSGSFENIAEIITTSKEDKQAYSTERLEELVDNIKISCPKLANKQNLVKLEDFNPISAKDSLNVYAIDTELLFDIPKTEPLNFFGIVIYPDVEYQDIKTGVPKATIQNYYKFSNASSFYKIFEAGSVNNVYANNPKFLVENISVKKQIKYFESLTTNLNFSKRTTPQIKTDKDIFVSDLFYADSYIASTKTIGVNCTFFFDYKNYLYKKSPVYEFLLQYFPESVLKQEINNFDDRIILNNEVFLRNKNHPIGNDPYKPANIFFKKQFASFKEHQSNARTTDKVLAVNFIDVVKDNFEREVTFNFTLTDPMIGLIERNIKNMERVSTAFNRLNGIIQTLIYNRYNYASDSVDFTIDEERKILDASRDLISKLRGVQFLTDDFIRIIEILLDPKSLNLQIFNTTREKINFIFSQFISQSKNYTTKTIQDQFVFKNSYVRASKPENNTFLSPFYVLRNTQTIPATVLKVNELSLFEKNNYGVNFYNPVSIKATIEVLSDLINSSKNNGYADSFYRQNFGGRGLGNLEVRSVLNFENLNIEQEYGNHYKQFYQFVFNNNYITTLAANDINEIHDQLFSNPSTIFSGDKFAKIKQLRDSLAIFFNNQLDNRTFIYGSQLSMATKELITIIDHFLYVTLHKAYYLSAFGVKDGERNLKKIFWEEVSESIITQARNVSNPSTATYNPNFCLMFYFKPVESPQIGIKHPDSINFPIINQYAFFTNDTSLTNR
jgi:hypothetical protein